MKIWKTSTTYDSDKYEETFRASKTDNDFLSLGIWACKTSVGPGAYNMSHIDKIINNSRNEGWYIMEPENPYYTSKCGSLSIMRVIFDV